MIEARNWKGYLEKEFESRKAKNSQYSLRSFASHLKISPTQLSMILSGKRTIKPKMALHLSETLGLTSIEMLSLLKGESSQKQDRSFQEPIVLSVDEFGPIASWHYFAILGLAGLRNNVADPAWIARKLNISVKQARDCFEDLLRLNHIKIKDGQFRQASNPFRTADDVSASVIRRYHKQSLQLAAQTIDTVDVTLREYTSMTIPVDPAKLNIAKKLIREFRESFTKEVSRGKRSEVYDLCIQFFPLTKIKAKEKRA